MNDAVVPVSYAMHVSPRRYALFLGAGVSIAAGLPSGKDITVKMIRELAIAKGVHFEGHDNIESCIRWFEEEHLKPATFESLLAELGITEANRNDGLQRFILPSNSDGIPYTPNPTPAHQIIAKLVKKGLLSFIITTNFDHLLEDAIRVEGLTSVVITSESDPKLMSIFPDQCRIVKVNGDFTSKSLKITPKDLEEYDPNMEDFLRRIFSEYGIVVCGWSGRYDKGILDILCSINTRRYPIFWSSLPKREILDSARDLLKPILIEIDSADEFFIGIDAVITRLQSIDRSQPLTLSIAVKKVTDALQQHHPELIITSLLHIETDLVLDELGRKGYVPVGPVSAQKIFIERIRLLESLTAPLAAMMATIAQYDGEKYSDIISDTIDRLINVPFSEPFTPGTRQISGIHQGTRFHDCLYHLRLFPALLVIYATGISATKANHLNVLGSIFSPKITRGDGIHQVPYFDSLNIPIIFYCSDLWLDLNRALFGDSGDIFTYVYNTVHRINRHLVPGERKYEEVFSTFEYIYSIAYLANTRRAISPNGINISEVSPLNSRFINQISYHGRLGLLDSLNSNLSGIGDKIRNTKFFNGDAQSFEKYNRRLAILYGIDPPLTGIESPGVVY